MVNYDKIRQLMIARKIQNQEFADKVGVSASMMSYITRGLREPNVTTLARIAHELGCTVDELLVKSAN